MLRSMTLIKLLFILSLLGSRLFAVGWLSQNVPPDESPEFSTPSEACAWYFGFPPLKEFTFSHVSSYGGIPSVTLPAGQLFCYGIWERSPGNVWNVGNAGYSGKLQDLDGKDENFYNNNAVISDELENLVRRSMRRYYGAQVEQWKVNLRMVKTFQKWVAKVNDGCSCFKFIPKPVTSPILSGPALVLYLVKYGTQIFMEQETEANYSCMLAAAAGMKTEFWEAGNLE